MWTSQQMKDKLWKCFHACYQICISSLVNCRVKQWFALEQETDNLNRQAVLASSQWEITFHIWNGFIISLSWELLSLMLPSEKRCPGEAFPLNCKCFKCFSTDYKPNVIIFSWNTASGRIARVILQRSLETISNTNGLNEQRTCSF